MKLLGIKNILETSKIKIVNILYSRENLTSNLAHIIQKYTDYKIYQKFNTTIKLWNKFLFTSMDGNW